jgi:DNA-binding response OmpR family regulator
LRILVVDDEVNLATSLQRGLAAEGFSVDVAHDGEEALWAATEQAYDIVVLDLMLPKLTVRVRFPSPAPPLSFT